MRIAICDDQQFFVEFNDISVKVKNIMYLVAAKKNTEIYITTDTIKIDRTPNRL